MAAKAFGSVLVLTIATIAATTPVLGQEDTPGDILRAEVEQCTGRALDRLLGPEEWPDWVTSCQRRASELCATQPRIDGSTDRCDEISRATWRAAADEVKSRLIQRWQSCNVPESVRSDMVQAVEDTDAAVMALSAANCGYDAAQWRAFGKPELAIVREPR